MTKDPWFFRFPVFTYESVGGLKKQLGKNISRVQGRVNNFKAQNKAGEDLAGAIIILLKFGFPRLQI